MRPSLGTPALALLTTFTTSTTALEALTNSPCAPLCGNVLGSTSGADIVCNDGDFTTTSAGTTFSNCISCQIHSNYTDPTSKQTDLQWGLYNLRYAISWCLFGYPNNPSAGTSPCTTSQACGPYQNAFEFDSLSTNGSSVSGYGYCAFMASSVTINCNNCLKPQSAQFYLTNFITALEAACVQQPTAGKTISIQGSLFSTTPVNITSPSTSPVSSFNGAPGGLSLGGKVGIAAAGLVAALFVTGFCIICNGKRRRRNAIRRRQEQSGYGDWRREHTFPGAPQPPPIMTAVGGNTSPISAARDGDSSAGGFSQQGFFDSPDSTRPLHPWAHRSDDVSPQTAAGEKVYFSPYSSQYSSPVSASEALQTNVARDWTIDRKASFSSPLSASDNSPYVGREWPADRRGSIGGSTGLGRFSSRSRSREKREKMSIEMQNVAPVLQHPGHGRSNSIPLTEEDARKGNAL